MLPKRQRLTVREFSDTWKRGTTTCGAFVCVRRITAPTPRYGCTAPKKFVRTVVARNRMRRQLYAALRHALTELPAASEYVILLPRHTIQRATHTALYRDIANTLRRARKIEK